MTEISKEYAAALFMLAEETGLAEEFSRSLDIMEDAFVQNPELVEYLAAPTIPKQERTQALQEIFGDLVQEYLLSFAQLLCEKGHIRSFVTCAREYPGNAAAPAEHRLCPGRERRGADRSRAAGDQEKTGSDKRPLGFAGVPYGPLPLAGLVVYMDGKVIDGSLRHRLRELKEVMDE